MGSRGRNGLGHLIELHRWLPREQHRFSYEMINLVERLAPELLRLLAVEVDHWTSGLGISL